MTTPTTPRPDHVSKEKDNQQKEWSKARDVLKEYDTRLHDLRKYGFSFVTVLLTAGSFITQSITESLSKSIGTDNITIGTEIGTSAPEPGLFTLGVFVVTFLLIIALHLFDKNYRVFQQAAYYRAVVIERKLNMELSDTIADRHKSGKIDRNVILVYILFIVGVTAIGVAILYPVWHFAAWLIASACVALFCIFYQAVKLRVEFRNKEYEEDWTVSPLECALDETIMITLNNFRRSPRKSNITSQKYLIRIIMAIGEFFKGIYNMFVSKDYSKDELKIIFPKNKVIWEIKDCLGKTQYRKKAEKYKALNVYDNYVWTIQPNDFFDKGKNSPYQLKPRGWATPLPISIIVQ